MSAPPRYVCRTCGTWTCGACGWKRPGAGARYADHSCNRCGCRTGDLRPTMHTEVMWRKHNAVSDQHAGVDWNAPLPRAYPYGVQADPDDLPPGYGARTADLASLYTYRGVPVPPSGPYQQLDLKSWQRGVDAALKAHPKGGGDRD